MKTRRLSIHELTGAASEADRTLPPDQWIPQAFVCETYGGCLFENRMLIWKRRYIRLYTKHPPEEGSLQVDAFIFLLKFMVYDFW